MVGKLKEEHCSVTHCDYYCESPEMLKDLDLVFITGYQCPICISSSLFVC
jgi:hypothetical protein